MEMPKRIPSTLRIVRAESFLRRLLVPGRISQKIRSSISNPPISLFCILLSVFPEHIGLCTETSGCSLFSRGEDNELIIPLPG